jgi:hypothetical protein
MMDVEEMASPREEEGGVFDLDTYIGRYEPLSETRLQRLLFLGQSADNEELAKSAFAMAAQHLQQVGNARTYRHIYGPTPQKQQKHQHQQQVAAPTGGKSHTIVSFCTLTFSRIVVLIFWFLVLSFFIL